MPGYFVGIILLSAISSFTSCECNTLSIRAIRPLMLLYNLDASPTSRRLALTNTG